MKKALLYPFVLVNVLATFAQQADYSGISNGQEICTDNGVIILTADNNTTGTFSGAGITDNANGTATFDPATAGAGSHTISYVVNIAEYVEITSGTFHSIGIKSDGTLWAWGRNNVGQLGDGTTIDKNSPVQIGTDTDWSQIGAGEEHSVGLKSDGTLWAWGANYYGQLGDGTTIDKNSPVQIGTDIDWSQINVGEFHNMGIKSDGSLWTWGRNSSGQIGDGTTTNRTSPLQVGTDIDWSQMGAGMSHSFGVKTDGTLWAWGNNNNGQLGDGTIINKSSPVQIGLDTDWSQIAAGINHSFGVKNNGTLWSWGGNSFGQLGDGTTTNSTSPAQVGTDTNWSELAAGYYHSLCSKSNGTLWAWGRNVFGQLGDGTTTNSNSPVQVGTDTNWSQLAAGSYLSMSIKSDGTLWSWGYNSHGQLGNGTTNNSSNSNPGEIHNPSVASTKIVTVLTTPAADAPSDLSACNNYTLPVLSSGDYYTGSGGTGSMLSAGFVITNTQTLYVYAQSGICVNENSFIVTITSPTAGTDLQTACNSFSWIDGNTYTSSNSTATYTLTNAAGCDSIVTLDLTINNSNTGIDVVTECDSYTWIDGNTYTASNNTATFPLTNVAGCDSIVTLDLTITPLPDNNVTQSGALLEADQTGATYQWLDCDDNNSVINNETNQAYTPSVTGNYAVEVNLNGCSDTSSCFLVDYTGIKELEAKIISIHPNPTSNILYISVLDQVSGVRRMEILSITGEVIEKLEGLSKPINVSKLPNGIYFLTIQHKTGVESIRFVKQ